MGGDHGPGVVVDGVVQAVGRSGVNVALVGPEAALRRELARHPGAIAGAIDIVDAPDAIAMSESPLSALRRKPHSSIRVAAELVASGRASAVFSAGHSGATLLVARTVFGSMSDIDRPALAVTVPTLERAAVLTIQSGINQLRYATLKGIMAAKKKEIRVVPAPAAQPGSLRIVSLYLPERAKATRMIAGAPDQAAGDLVRALRDEARVL